MMLGSYYKGIAGPDSMQEMTKQFNDETVSKNLSVFIGEKAGEHVPHHVTANEYLEKLDPVELEEIKQDCEIKAFTRLTGKHYPYMQLERPCAEEPLSDGTDFRFYETSV